MENDMYQLSGVHPLSIVLSLLICYTDKYWGQK